MIVSYPDPYSHSCGWITSPLRGLANFLVLTYNLFINGWVEDITVYAKSGTSATSIAIGSVKHSQRRSSTPCKSWIAARNEGTILCAHCTCMAGLGEACSHIGAILFTLDKNTQYQKTTTCTSLPCSWLPPTFQNVPYSELAMISFATPQHKRCRSEKETEDTSPQAAPCGDIPMRNFTVLCFL